MLRAKTIVAAAVVLAGVLLISSEAQGGDIIYVDADAPPGGDGQTWATAFADLQDALAGASTGDEIWVADGTYLPAPNGDRSASFRLKNGVGLYGGFAGSETSRDQRNWTVNQTIFSGDLNSDDGPNFQRYFENSLHVVDGSYTKASAVMDGVTVTAGNANVAVHPNLDAMGGGMLIVSGAPTIANCTFTRNRGTLFGAGMCNAYYSAPTLNNCLFLENRGVSMCEGGGLSNVVGCDPTLIGCVFRGNLAGDFGGGVSNTCDSDSLLVNCTFEGNGFSAAESWGLGGGWYGGGNPWLINCKFTGNWSCGDGPEAGGGAVHCAGYPTFVNCTITGNSAFANGGGVYIVCEHATFDNCILWGNQDTHGTATDESAQIYVDEDYDPPLPTVRYSCVQDSDPNDAEVYPGEGNIDDDPLFLHDPDDGGDGWGVGDNDDYGDLHLGWNSPCIDAGDNLSVPSDSQDLDNDTNTAEPIPWDLDDLPRFVDDLATPDTGYGEPPIVDLGVYEAQGDCNGNGLVDTGDIAAGTSDDCNGNAVPDECERDCNLNGVTDDCDLASGASSDCNYNDIPDECERDCNSNGVADDCDIASGASRDCNYNDIPDDCERDCNSNGVADDCDIASGASDDCNANGTPDECDLAAGTSQDTNGDSLPDECVLCVNDSSCDDGLFCNGTETCTASGVCQPGTLPCPASVTCDESKDQCIDCTEDADCDDGVFCNGTETCAASGVCQPGTPPCPSSAACDESKDRCTDCADDADCDDGLFCNGLESCTVFHICRSGEPPCPVGWTCDEKRDQCTECLQDADCADDLFCNGAEACVLGTCYPQAAPCPGRLCDETADTCLACLDDGDCDDDDACTIDTCTGNICINSEVPNCTDRPVGDPYADSDRDGVRDVGDACPDTPWGHRVDSDGCSCGQLDRDGDGVNECADECPGTPIHAAVDDNGCSCLQLDPLTDDDGDGVVDCLDSCLGTAYGVRVDGNGCSCLQRDPDSDGDGDGVPDCVDLCPDTSLGVIVDATGCLDPDYLPREATAGLLVEDKEVTQSEPQALTGTVPSRSGTCGAVGMVNLLFIFGGLCLCRRCRSGPASPVAQR